MVVSEHEELAAQTAVSAVLTSDAEGVVAVALVVGANAPVAVMRADVQLLREVSLSKEVRNVWHEELIPEGIRETWNSNVSHCHTRTMLMKGICRIDTAGEWAD